MSIIEIILGVVIVIGLAVLWAFAARGVEARRGFTDADADGAPDATESEKRATIQMFDEDQARLHPEDHPKPPRSL